MNPMQFIWAPTGSARAGRASGGNGIVPAKGGRVERVSAVVEWSVVGSNGETFRLPQVY